MNLFTNKLEVAFSSNIYIDSLADPGENLTGALHSNFGSNGCGGRGYDVVKQNRMISTFRKSRS